MSGAFAVKYAENCSIEECLNFANAAGGVACTRVGTLPAIPNRKEVDELVKKGRDEK